MTKPIRTPGIAPMAQAAAPANDGAAALLGELQTPLDAAVEQAAIEVTEAAKMRAKIAELEAQNATLVKQTETRAATAKRANANVDAETAAALAEANRTGASQLTSQGWVVPSVAPGVVSIRATN